MGDSETELDSMQSGFFSLLNIMRVEKHSLASSNAKDILTRRQRRKKSSLNNVQANAASSNIATLYKSSIKDAKAF